MFDFKRGDILFYRGLKFYKCIKVNLLYAIISDSITQVKLTNGKDTHVYINLGNIYSLDDIKELNQCIFNTFMKIIEYDKVPIIDIFNRELSVGDFIMYYSDINLPKPIFGILYSQREIFTKYGIIEVNNRDIFKNDFNVTHWPCNYVYKIDINKYAEIYDELVKIYNLNIKYSLTKQLENNTLFIDYVDNYSREYHLESFNKLDSFKLYLYYNDVFYISSLKYNEWNKINRKYNWKPIDEKRNNLTESLFIMGEYKGVK